MVVTLPTSWQTFLRANTSGSLSMYELNGTQYLLVTAAGGAGDRGRGGAPAPTETPAGPTGVVAYALR